MSIEPRSLPLPRARGDGPGRVWIGGSEKGLPPRPRGWSGSRRAASDPPAIAPAPAGMVRSGHHGFGRPARCPRARGDGPSAEDLLDTFTELPPRPRGWSGQEVLGEHPDDVAPAPAGMVRGIPVPATELRRCPRARGDGPRGSGHPGRRRMLPPRPRGILRPCAQGAQRALSPLLVAASLADRASRQITRPSRGQ